MFLYSLPKNKHIKVSVQYSIDSCTNKFFQLWYYKHLAYYKYILYLLDFSSAVLFVQDQKLHIQLDSASVVAYKHYSLLLILYQWNIITQTTKYNDDFKYRIWRLYMCIVWCQKVSTWLYCNSIDIWHTRTRMGWIFIWILCRWNIVGDIFIWSEYVHCQPSTYFIVYKMILAAYHSTTCTCIYMYMYIW